MSVEAITWALSMPIRHSSAKFVLVALANCADADMLAWPSVAYLCDATSQDRKTVLANLERLRDIGLIEDTGKRKGETGRVVIYRINRTETGAVKQSQKRNDSESGIVPKFPINSTEIPEKQSQISHVIVPKTGRGTVRNRHRTVKEPSTRAREVEPPDWLPATAWAEWRKFRGAKFTQAAERLSLRTLGRLRDSGHDPTAVIEQSIERGWTGLFELRQNGPPARASPSRADRNAEVIRQLTGRSNGPEPTIVDITPPRIAVGVD